MNFSKICLNVNKTLSVCYVNDDGDNVSVDGANVVHGDLVEAFDKLATFLALLAEQVPEDYTFDDVERQRALGVGIPHRIKVSGIKKTFDGYMLTGTRMLSAGGILKINTPRVSRDGSEEYPFFSKMILALEEVEYETECYIKNKKWRSTQVEMDFEEPFGEIEAGEVPKVNVEMKVS